MNIAENIEFDETKLLSEQSKEFQDWYYKNIDSQITDKTLPDSLDEFDRPFAFTINYDSFIVETIWLYINETKSNWARRGCLVTFKSN